MDTTNSKRLVKSATNSLPSLTKRLVERMTSEEAIRGATRMLTAYPETAREMSRDYLMTLAETLCQYPREIATQACSPVHGVPKECKSFRPTAGQVAEWCEIRTEPIFDRYKSERPELPPPTMPEAEMAKRKIQVDRVLASLPGRLKWPEGKSQPGWLTPEAAAEILAKYEREAKQSHLQDEELI